MSERSHLCGSGFEVTAVIVNQDILATTAKHLTNDCLLTFLNLIRLRKKSSFFRKLQYENIDSYPDV